MFHQNNYQFITDRRGEVTMKPKKKLDSSEIDLVELQRHLEMLKEHQKKSLPDDIKVKLDSEIQQIESKLLGVK